jgi:hypothetical protein
VTGAPPAAAQRAYYSATLAEFRAARLDEIVGRMARHHDFDLTGAQRDAWLAQGVLLQQVLPGQAGAIYLEFTIPRMGRRIDAVVLVGAVIFVLEFKIGERDFHAQDVDQVVDYALDLQNFHEGSHDAFIAPVLVCTEAPANRQRVPSSCRPDRLFDVARTNAQGLAAVLEHILGMVTGPALRLDEWEASRYKPTPTIIEATLALYRGHSVAEISRSDAGATNLSVTAGTVAAIVEHTRARSGKAICFVTGVPGAGKTLVGLDAATRHIDRDDELYSVFLSGNGPLVAILQEALARDKVWQSQRRGTTIRKGARRRYLKNAHRVLLTRARQGMVVVVPSGDIEDPTRHPTFYDPTYEYLVRSGLAVI